MDDGESQPRVFRERFVSRDIGEVEEFMRGTYTEVSMHLPDDQDQTGHAPEQSRSGLPTTGRHAR